MDTIGTIKLHTLLGQSLEDVFALSLDEMGIVYQRSESDEQDLHRADFVFSTAEHIYVFQVTNTRQPETFIKKRWRYIEQICQVKSIMGPDVICVSVVFGFLQDLQTAERIMAESIFDAVIWCQEILNSNDAEGEIEKYIVQVKRSPNVKGMAIQFNHIGSLVDRIKDLLSSVIINKNANTQSSLFWPVWEYENKTYPNRRTRLKVDDDFDISKSYLRRTFFKLACLPNNLVKQLLETASSVGNWPPELEAMADYIGIGYQRAIGSRYRLNDKEIIPTINRGYNINMHKDLINGLIKHGKYKFLIRDIQSPEHLRYSAQVTIPILEELNENKFSFLLFNTFKNPNLHGVISERVWPLDVLLSVISVSASEINRRYINIYGHLGVSNPVKNFIVRTEQALSSFKDEDRLKEFADKLAKLCISLLPEIIPDIEDIVIKMRLSRLESLFLQPYVNPTTQLFEQRISQYEWTFELSNLPSALGIVNVPGRMKKVEDLYICTRSNNKRLVKVISAYEEGVGHKSIEMSGRRRMLNFTKQGSQLVRSLMPETHFIWEGVWNSNHLKTLHLAGWDQIYDIWDLESRWK